MADEYLIVDGHSVIFAWPELQRQHTRKNSVAREELVRLLTRYQDSSEVRVVLVFDGQGSKVSESSEPGGIQVFYSRSGQTADAIIERLVAKYGSQYRLTIATGDRAIQQTAITFEGSFIDPKQLGILLEEAAHSFSRELEKRAKSR